MRSARRRRREQRDPWTSDPRDPLEVLARLVGRCAFTPGGMGTGGARLLDSDLTTALGYMPDKAESALAMSVAGRTGALMGVIARRTWKRVLRSVQEQRGLLDLSDGANRHRLRVVLRDVIEATIWPERRAPMAVAAKAAKMRNATYGEVYRHVEGKMQEVLADARRNFKARMWADALAERIRAHMALHGNAAGGAVGVVLMDTRAEQWSPIGFWSGRSRAALAASLRESTPFGPAWMCAAAEVAENLPALVPGRRHVEHLREHDMAIIATAW